MAWLYSWLIIIIIITEVPQIEMQRLPPPQKKKTSLTTVVSDFFFLTHSCQLAGRRDLMCDCKLAHYPVCVIIRMVNEK